MALVLNQLGEPVGILEDYMNLKWSRQFYKAGAMQLQINRNQFNAEFIQQGNLILPNELGELNEIYLIEQLETVIDESGKEGEILSVTGRSIGGMLEERLGLPPVGFAYDDQIDAAETLMKYWVDLHAVNPVDTNREIPNLVVEADQARGGTVNYALRYQTIAKMLEDIARANDIGWEVFYDIDSNTYNFDVIIPEDKTISSSNPVFFDISFETILGSKVLNSVLEQKSYAYVGGDGEGASRTIIETYLTSIEPSGFNRKEVFVDGGNLSNTDDLTRKGKVFLNETLQEDTVEVDINTLGSFQYRTDWDLGDIVTFRNKNWDYQADIKIIGITIEVNQGEGQPLIGVQLGNQYPTIKNKVDRTVGDKERERV